MSTIKENYYEAQVLESTDYKKTSSLSLKNVCKIEDLNDESLKLPRTLPTEENSKNE